MKYPELLEFPNIRHSAPADYIIFVDVREGANAIWLRQENSLLRYQARWKDNNITVMQGYYESGALKMDLGYDCGCGDQFFAVRKVLEYRFN